MRIFKRTATVLTLQPKNRLLDYAILILFGSTFFGVGLGTIIIFGKLAVLKCDRIEPTQVTCELISSDLLGQDVAVIRRLQGAEVDVSSDSDSDTYRIVLIANSKRIPLTKAYSAGASGKYQKVDQINTFINNSAASSLKIQEEHRWFAYPFGGVFMLCGGGITLTFLLQKTPTLCVFDKASGRVFLKRQNMLFQSDTQEEKLDAIKMAQVNEITDTDGDTSYSTELVFKSGDPISLESSLLRKSGLIGKFERASKFELAQSINQFLEIKPDFDT
ncbi:MAG: hypothetical protein F6K19_06000 [Cyanothece sp. SIO1E1]|nr:hypothetical protein [Cyanothece sp. SIO1E1]